MGSSNGIVTLKTGSEPRALDDSGLPGTVAWPESAFFGEDTVAPSLFNTVVPLTTVPGSMDIDGMVFSAALAASDPFLPRAVVLVRAEIGIIDKECAGGAAVRGIRVERRVFSVLWVDEASVEPARTISFCFRRWTSSALRPEVARPRWRSKARSSVTCRLS